VLGLVRQKQAIGILGMIFASAGGIAWFFQAAVPALILWGVAIIIIFKLKRKRKK
jgi:4-hydroxybenzoate polyprenyltransferase